MSRAAIAIFAIVCAAPFGAVGQPIRVAPDPCPVPTDIAPFVNEDVGTYELNSWDDRLDDVLLFRNVPVADGALTLRIFPDPITGEIDGFPTEPADCGSDPYSPE